MWSYNIVPNPPVYGFSADSQGQVQLVTIGPSQALDDIVAANAGALSTVLTDGFGQG
jgi:hypothetical protein